MEMHQVRYFLSAAAELNFTKAAEKCNVSQPSLTRAIKQLESELGGDLFRRERPQAQLTGLGERMYPLIKQCYESALGARSLASSIKNGELGALKLALSHAVDLDPFIPYVNELIRLFARIELKLLRGTSAEVVELLKNGEAELAVACDIGEPWERLERWPLFTESFCLVARDKHQLASRSPVEIEDLRAEQILRRSYCEQDEQAAAILRARGIDADLGHEIGSDRDLLSLLEAGLGVAVIPCSTSLPATLKRLAVNGMGLRRTVYLYAVAGRQRTAVASAILKMLRAADWLRYAN
jgi:DNA-binding transcriptional LysR family regulator